VMWACPACRASRLSLKYEPSHTTHDVVSLSGTSNSLRTSKDLITPPEALPKTTLSLLDGSPPDNTTVLTPISSTGNGNVIWVLLHVAVELVDV